MGALTYLEDVDEFSVGDVAVLVLIKVVENDAKLLSGEENSKLGHELLELKLLQDSILVAIETLQRQTSQTISKYLNSFPPQSPPTSLNGHISF